MDQLRQRTIAKQFSVSGIGLHTGAPVTLYLKPAPESHGVTFRRLDVAGALEIPAQPLKGQPLPRRVSPESLTKERSDASDYQRPFCRDGDD